MDVSVIIVNYQSCSDTQACVSSILKSETTFSYEILIVDNRSPDGSFEILKRLENEQVRVLCAAENRGYCAGNNIGIKYAMENSNPKYIWILNPDTLVESDSMQRLFDFQESHGDCGILGCRLIYYPDTQYLQGLGGGMFGRNKFGALVPKRHLYHMCASGSDLPEFVKIDLVIGASMFVRKEVFEKCGLMDERFHLYSDENEFCLRSAKFGFIHYATSRAAVYHKEGWRGGAQKLAAVYYTARNSLFMTEKLFPENMRNQRLYRRYTLLKKFAKGLVRHDWKEFRLIRKALRDFKRGVYGRADLSGILEEK